jgi:hypothetical protein
MKRGLSLSPTYDQVLNSYLSGGPDIKKPNRVASFIRASPQYQDLLKNDFIDLQKQQNDMLKKDRTHLLMKEQSSQSGSDMKSAIASQSPAVSEASQKVQSDLSAVSVQSGGSDDFMQLLGEWRDEMAAEDEAKKQRMAVKGKADMDAYVGNTRKLADKFLAAKTRGTEDYSGTTGDKQLEKNIAEGQQLDMLRVLPPGLKVYPRAIDELSDDKAAIERHRQHLGLPASSSSGPQMFNISSPRPDRFYKAKSRDLPATGETDNPETHVAKKGPAGRPVNPNSARQKKLAKAAAKK